MILKRNKLISHTNQSNFKTQKIIQRRRKKEETKTHSKKPQKRCLINLNNQKQTKKYSEAHNDLKAPDNQAEAKWL